MVTSSDAAFLSAAMLADGADLTTFDDIRHKGVVRGERDRKGHTKRANVPFSKLQDIAEYGREIDIGTRETLFAQGAPADYVYIVTCGYAKIYSLLPDGRCMVHGFVFPGDYLGLAMNGAYAYFAATLTPATVRRFGIHDIERLKERHSDIVKRLLCAASEELVAAQDHMVTLGRKTAVGKVASFLVMMQKKLEAGHENGDRIYLPMTRSDIADYLGMSVETISRTMSRLAVDGIVRKNGEREILCLRPQALIDLANTG